MAIWICSDWHLCHQQSFLWQPRGFNSVEEMNQAILERHNSVVNPEDDVYVLGDLNLNNLEEGLNIISRMNGKLHIACGNHCTKTRRAAYATLPNVVEIADAYTIDYGKYHFWCSHFPAKTSNFDNDKPPKARVWNLCGHTHTFDPFLEWKEGWPCYHVEMEAHNCYPCLLDDIIVEIERKWKEYKGNNYTI